MQHDERLARGRIASTLVLALAIAASAAADIDRLIDNRPIAPPAEPMVMMEPAPDRAIAAPTSRLGREAVQTIAALGGVIGVILLLRQVLRRVGDPLAARRPSGVVQVLSRFPFGRQQQIVLLQVGTRVLCVHQSNSAVTTLCELRDAGEIADLRARIEAGTPERQRFERELSRQMTRGDESAAAQRSPLLGLPMTPTMTVDLTGKRNGLFGLFRSGGTGA